ncbi:MAG: DNA repair protein RadC [Deltaproteobacteria bacterium]|nr:DNA repair protein RadC [Deltaproteobacteria bacterium]MBW2420670.1 DNA repair protein RadC [Deltaproteobacteria bacterium]
MKIVSEKAVSEAPRVLATTRGLRDSAADDRPRERLHALGAGLLSDSELLALVLRTGGRDADALELSRGLLGRCGGLRGLAQAGRFSLGEVTGMGPAKVASLEAAFELGRRLAARRLRSGDSIRGPEDVHRHFHQRLRDARYECFLALLLDARHRVLSEVVVSQGTLTASLVHPREVFRIAVREAAAALLLIHNHPSGDPSPSREDRVVTERLVQAGRLLGIKVVDHVVVAEQGYFSFRESGAPELASEDASPQGEPVC